MIRRETLFVLPGCCVQVSALSVDENEGGLNRDSYKGYNTKNINDMVNCLLHHTIFVVASTVDLLKVV